MHIVCDCKQYSELITVMPYLLILNKGLKTLILDGSFKFNTILTFVKPVQPVLVKTIKQVCVTFDMAFVSVLPSLL